jgi:hypothetical protein
LKRNDSDATPKKLKSNSFPEKTNKQIGYVVGQLNSEDLYACATTSKTTPIGQTEPVNDKNQKLPIDWEQHEDENGLYFWHTKTGVTQREQPTVQKEIKATVAVVNPVTPKTRNFEDKPVAQPIM